MDKDPIRFQTNDDAADAARSFERYDLIVAPVVNTHQQLVGCLKVDDMLDYLRQSSTRTCLPRWVSAKDEDLFARPWKAARGRWAWIALNLFTAFVASRIIGQFEGTIEKIVALAALMPIVASVGGNTGQQTLALMIQGMALKQVNSSNFRYLLSKEVGVALINGMLWGGVMGTIAWALYGRLSLGVIMFAAMGLTCCRRLRGRAGADGTQAHRPGSRTRQQHHPDRLHRQFRFSDFSRARRKLSQRLSDGPMLRLTRCSSTRCSPWNKMPEWLKSRGNRRFTSL